jgi:hypothetical protein
MLAQRLGKEARVCNVLGCVRCSGGPWAKGVEYRKPYGLFISAEARHSLSVLGPWMAAGPPPLIQPSSGHKR